jgi:hypothetical protein
LGKHISSNFDITPQRCLQNRSFVNKRISVLAAGIVLLSVLLYQIIVYYNCKTPKQYPNAIKHMLGS